MPQYLYVPHYDNGDSWSDNHNHLLPFGFTTIEECEKWITSRGYKPEESMFGKKYFILDLDHEVNQIKREQYDNDWEYESAKFNLMYSDENYTIIQIEILEKAEEVNEE